MFNYANMPLNRASRERRDKNWLTTTQAQNSQWLLLDEDRSLFVENSTEIVELSIAQLDNFNLANGIFLGQSSANGYFALDITQYSSEQKESIKPLGEFVDLRRYGSAIDGQKASILAFARGLCYWHRTHSFCGRCGYPNEAIDGGHARLCTNHICLHQTFPRTDPAVIMLVSRTFGDGIERCLLGRQASWMKGAYSTLAGFVDPGETLEQAVRREVMEEAGIAVGEVKYMASQPWPFPSSIMLGFIAKATSETIKVDQNELEQADWFSRKQLSQFGSWGDDFGGYKLPRADSISRYLIEEWLKGS